MLKGDLTVMIAGIFANQSTPEHIEGFHGHLVANTMNNEYRGVLRYPWQRGFRLGWRGNSVSCLFFFCLLRPYFEMMRRNAARFFFQEFLHRSFCHLLIHMIGVLISH